MNSSVAPPKNQELTLLTFLWDVIIKTVLSPLFNHNNHNLVPLPKENICLSPMLSAHRFNKGLFPFIHERLPLFIFRYYAENVLVYLRGQTDGLNMLTSLQESWEVCTYKTSTDLEEILKPLEDAYRQVVRKFEFVSIREVVIHQFQNSVYQPLADSVRKFGFSCISKDGIITNRDGLEDVHMIIQSVSSVTTLSCTSEWDRPVMFWLFAKMEDNVNSWTTASVKSFLGKLRFRLREFHSIVLDIRSELEAYRRFLQAVSGFRDKLLFHNNAAKLRILLQNEDSAPELLQLFSFFHDDQAFLQAISAHSGECFKTFIVGANQESHKELLRKEGVFRRFLLTWKRMHSILRNVSTKNAFSEVVLAPLTGLIGNTSKPSRKIWDTQKFLAEHCHSLLSTNRHGKQILASKEDEIFEIVSLACYMRSTDAFVETHRFLLSKRLLGGTSVSQSLENEIAQLLLKHDSVLVHGIKVILSDTKYWSVYGRENFVTVQDQCHDIIIEPKLINRRYWPLEEDVGIVMSRQFQMISRNISKYFKSKQPHRLISVHSTAGQAIIRTKVWEFKGDPVKLKLTTAQFSLLSLFEKSKKLSVKQIYFLLHKSDTKPTREFVFNLIRSMIGKFPVLTKEPGAQNILETDNIRLNRDFQPNESLVTLPVPDACKNNPKQSERSALVETEENLTDFRKQRFESIIVKVLKKKRIIDLNVLKEVAYSEVGLNPAWGDESFEKTVSSLGKRDFLIVDGNTVRFSEYCTSCHS